MLEFDSASKDSPNQLSVSMAQLLLTLLMFSFCFLSFLRSDAGHF